MGSSQCIANVPVTAAQLRNALEAIRKDTASEPASLNTCVRVIIKALLESGIDDQQQLADVGSAICTRLAAFSRLMHSVPAERWLASAVCVSADVPLLEAMASAPLREKQGRYDFEVESFFDVVLERSPVAGRG